MSWFRPPKVHDAYWIENALLQSFVNPRRWWQHSWRRGPTYSVHTSWFKDIASFCILLDRLGPRSALPGFVFLSINRSSVRRLPSAWQAIWTSLFCWGAYTCHLFWDSPWSLWEWCQARSFWGCEGFVSFFQKESVVFVVWLVPGMLKKSSRCCEASFLAFRRCCLDALVVRVASVRFVQDQEKVASCIGKDLFWESSPMTLCTMSWNCTCKPCRDSWSTKKPGDFLGTCC